MRNIFLIFTTIFCIFLSSCSSPRIQTPGESAKVFVFPYGKYQHDVHLSILGKAGEPPMHYRLNGVARVDENLIQIVGLSSFGTTVFKITDHLVTKKIEDEIYLPQMKAHEDKVLGYYELLKKLMTLKTNDAYHEGSIIQIEPGTEFVFGAFDLNHIPKSMTIHSPRFDIQIEVTRYDF